MAFMFESCLMVGVTEWGLKACQKVQKEYNAEVSLSAGFCKHISNSVQSWLPLKPHFRRPGKKIENGVEGVEGIDGDKSQLPHYT